MNTNLTKDDLKSETNRAQLGLALSDMLQGIASEWELSRSELSKILHIPEATIKGWLNGKSGKVYVGTMVDNNLQTVIDFIKLYNLAASFYVTKADQISWLKTPSNRFEDKSPLLMMMNGDAHSLYNAKSILEWVTNP